MNAWIALLLIGAAIGWSLWVRANHIRNKSGIDTASATTSPLSQAIQELVGTAGGIYLSIIALISFLKIEIPDKITFSNISFDPLAFIAIVIAIIQPIIIRLLSKERR